MPTHVVTAFLRHGADVLLVRRADDAPTYPGRWAGVSGYAEGDPDAQVWVELREETGLGDADLDLVRAGDPLDVRDGDTHWVVHSYLFDAATRDVVPNAEIATVEWTPPTAMRERETVPGLWAAYDRVRPTLESVRDDREHGSAFLSLRALDVLRDESVTATDWTALAAVARELRDAHPDMAALRTRIDRAMTRGREAGKTPEAVREAAITVARGAADADDRAAAEAASLVRGKRVATLSRSGTVEAALRDADPASVVVGESRPGGEGVGVAERLAAAGIDVTLTADAHLPTVVADCDVVLVGADAVTPDGSVVNKVGTRALAIGAHDAGVPVYACCAADKVAPDPVAPTASADPGALADVAEGVRVECPLFDVTPGRLVTGVVTERGVLDTDGVRAVADDHRRLAAWLDDEPGSETP